MNTKTYHTAFVGLVGVPDSRVIVGEVALTNSVGLK